MTSAQVVETSVTNNSSFQNYPHPDDHKMQTTIYMSLSANNIVAKLTDHIQQTRLITSSSKKYYSLDFEVDFETSVTSNSSFQNYPHP